MLQPDEDEGFFDADKELEREWRCSWIYGWLYENETSYRYIIQNYNYMWINDDEGYCEATLKEILTIINAARQINTS